MPFPVTDSNASACGQVERQLAGAGDDGLAQGVLGAHLGGRGQAQQVRLGEAVRWRPPAVTAGLPRVRVPVLSRTMASIRRACSRASPPRMRMPYSAALPVPTMMAVGVARPRAQGQAMISTAMAVLDGEGEAPGARGRGPASPRR